jgi:hypothetical protein
MSGERKLIYPVLEKIYHRNFPVLDIGERIGPTGYIDFIPLKEITHPVMIGNDFFKRKFIIIKAIVYKKICVQTFFQRYSDNVDLWMGCHVNGDCYNLLETVGGMKYSQALLIKDIVEGKNVKLEEKHRPCYYLTDSVLNKNVILYEEKKWKAVETIQKHWNIYRYNPTYKLCRKFIHEKASKLGL